MSAARGKHEKQRLAGGRDRTRVVVLPAPCFVLVVCFSCQAYSCTVPLVLPCVRRQASLAANSEGTTFESIQIFKYTGGPVDMFHAPSKSKVLSPPVPASRCSLTTARSLALRCRLYGASRFDPFLLMLPRGIHDSRLVRSWV
jgi:hypothetical protein